MCWLHVRNHRLCARHSGNEGTRRTPPTCRTAPAAILNGTLWVTAFPSWAATARFLRGGGCWVNIEGRWDLIIAHPPCTHLAVSGARWFPEKQRDFRQQKACVLFMQMMLADADRVAVENPVGIMSNCYRKPEQIIQPWMFGHGETKATCLWLKGLPKLRPTNIVEGREQRVWKLPPSEDRAKLRSKTFPGIGRAMAEQWG